MRVALLCLFALGLAACARHPSPAQGQMASGCARSAEAEIVFSDPTRKDQVTATAAGPSCAEAAVTLTLRNADGKLLWVFSAPYRLITMGDGGGPEGYAPTPQQVDQFLASWADLTLQKTSALPAWPEGADHLTGGDSGLSYDTDLGRDAYEMIRARDLPDACFAAAAEGSECIVIDPLSHDAMSIVRFGP